MTRKKRKKRGKKKKERGKKKFQIKLPRHIPSSSFLSSRR